MYFLPPKAFTERLNLLEKVAERAPNNPTIIGDQVGALQRVGRMNESAEAARRAAELDPLSPMSATNYIMALAYAGQLSRAREELAEAEKIWAGTAALRDAQWSFHLRYGDPKIAKSLANFEAPALQVYLDARADPSPEKVGRVAAHFEGSGPGERGFDSNAIQALGEFDQVDLAFARLFAAPAAEIAAVAYVLFRPALAGIRRDPRFMTLTKRIGLVDYWRSTGRWPDFCGNPTLPYDCKFEATKLG